MSDHVYTAIISHKRYAAHIYIKLIFVQKLFQSASDVLRICACVYTMSREKFNVQC